VVTAIFPYRKALFADARPMSTHPDRWIRAKANKCSGLTTIVPCLGQVSMTISGKSAESIPRLVKRLECGSRYLRNALASLGALESTSPLHVDLTLTHRQLQYQSYPTKGALGSRRHCDSKSTLFVHDPYNSARSSPVVGPQHVSSTGQLRMT
jgi:hypothetical protein